MQSDSMVEAMKAGWIDLNVIMSYMHWPGEPAWTERLALRRLNGCSYNMMFLLYAVSDV
jgi:hypothetical protein